MRKSKDSFRKLVMDLAESKLYPCQNKDCTMEACKWARRARALRSASRKRVKR